MRGLALAMSDGEENNEITVGQAQELYNQKQQEIQNGDSLCDDIGYSRDGDTNIIDMTIGDIYVRMPFNNPFSRN
jgi:hypothetical protein